MPARSDPPGSSTRDRRWRLLAGFAGLIAAGHLSLWAVPGFASAAPEFVAIYLATSLFYLLACFLVVRWHGAGGERQLAPSAERRWLWLIASAGLLFRAILLPLDPGLSEDLYRYRWQGKLQAAGGDPYRDVPADPRWKGLRDETWESVNRKDLPSAYGPLLELIYHGWYHAAAAITADPFRQAWLFKFPFAALELAAGWAVLALLRAAGRPPTWVLIYWWSPLVTVEYWAQGHNDPLAILLVTLALTAAERGRWSAAYASLAAAVMAKFWPLILFPFFVLRRTAGGWRLRGKPVLAALPVAAALAWPYRESLWEVRVVLEEFVAGWRNNDSLFGLIYRAVEEDFDRAAVWVRRLLLAALAALWVSPLRLTVSCLWAIALLLMFSANCFPWYLGWLMPLLALHPRPALLLWSALSVLSYHILIGYEALGVWQDSDFFRALEYLPVYGLLVATAALQIFRRLRTWRKARG